MNGIEVTKQVEFNGKKEFKSTSTPLQAMCFDYEMIMENFNINLEIDTTDFEETEVSNEEEENKKLSEQQCFSF